MTHNELINSLARSLMLSNRIVFSNVGLGAAWLGSARSRGIVDLISFTPKYNYPDITIYEIKAGRGDLLQDIKKEKYKKYAPFCERLVFAFPIGLATAKDIPDECGIATYNPNKKSWHSARRGITNNNATLDYEMFMSILISTHFKEQNRHDKQYFIERFLENGCKRDSMKFGKKVSNALWERDSLTSENEYLRYSNKEYKNEIAKLKEHVPINLCAYFDNGYCGAGRRSTCTYMPSSPMSKCWKSEIVNTTNGGECNGKVSQATSSN